MYGTNTLPVAGLASPPHSPQRAHGSLSRPKSPVKLTPLERKDRDRQRQKEQAKRRLQVIKDRDVQATALLANQHKSSQWHHQERHEEELVLRRLERDLVDVQQCHPSAAGYRFSPAREARDATKNSPVFQGYSPAPCPASQAPSYSSKTPAVTVTHPAFTSYCIIKQNDATAISPVFFLLQYRKIPLEEVDMGDEDEADGSANDSDNDDDTMQSQDQFLARQQQRDGPGAGRIATITKLPPAQQLELQAVLRGRFADDAGAACLVCQGRAAIGCPGCFEFAHRTYKQSQSIKSTQRCTTHGQEDRERHVRYKGLRLKLMGFGRHSEDNVVDGDDAEAREPRLRQPTPAEQRDYYADVLADIHAIRKHRTVVKNYVTLHIKTLPVGNLISLQVDVKATIAYVYELYRANMDSPNRKIHLLLPTMAGLFYLNELMEAATDTRCGLVNGEFLVEDFHLHNAPPASPASTLVKRHLLRDATSTTRPAEFMLFSVAILSEVNTPQLVANFLQQNFHFDAEPMTGDSPHVGLRIEYAIARLPLSAIADDAYQKRLVPHVHRMKEFARVSKQLEQLEAERQRARLLWIAYEERKLARLEHKKRQHRMGDPGDGRGHRKRKVTRAIAYLEFVLDSTGNPHRPRVWEERLEKLWQCAQFFEQWKICKHGRLVDAENTADTRQLVQRHVDATVRAFDTLLQRTAGAGPLVYPIQCLGTGSQQRLAVKIGVRLGCSGAENYEYGLVLNVDEDFVASEYTLSVQDSEAEKRMTKRGSTKKQLLAGTEDQANATRDEAASGWRCADADWKLRSTETSGQSSLLFTGSDLLRMPFLQFPWHRVVQAYKHVLPSVTFHLATLDAYNSLARLLQQEDAQLSKAQIEKWSGEVQHYETALLELTDDSNASLLKNSALLKATQRVLEKKGVALLKKRLRQRRQQMREREAELERLQALQEANATPKKSMVELLKTRFIQDKAPKINALLEPTPAERLLLKAEQLLGAVATKAAHVAQSAKKEYDVRAL